MIQAAINPETKEFLGLIIPAADLVPGVCISVSGTAEDWAALTRGESVPPGKVGVIRSIPGARSNVTITHVENPAIPEAVEVDNLESEP